LFEVQLLLMHTTRKDTTWLNLHMEFMVWLHSSLTHQLAALPLTWMFKLRTSTMSFSELTTLTLWKMSLWLVTFTVLRV
jgi:hypothetical protein